MKKYFSILMILSLFFNFLSPIAVASENSSNYKIYNWSFWAAMITGAVALIWLGVTAFKTVQWASRTAEEVQKLHPSWSEEICKLVTEGAIKQGMTKEQVEVARGKPSDINRTVTKYGSSEQWVYGEYTYVTYIYFEDGKLTGWQT